MMDDFDFDPPAIREPKNKMVEIKDVKPGELFKFKNQRYFRLLMNSVFLDGDNIPEHHKNKLLVIVQRCRQYVVEPTELVEIKIF